MIRSAASALMFTVAVSSVMIGPPDSAAAAVGFPAEPTAAAARSAPAPTVDPIRPADRQVDSTALGALLAGDDAGAIHVSESFIRRFGYTPQWHNAMAVRPDGSCSSPLPLPDSFRLPCAAHDFGYDLLRHVHPAGSAERRGIDAVLVARIGRQCTSSSPPTGSRQTCRILIGTVASGLAANTWRQNGGPPWNESAADILLSLVRKVLPT